MLNEIIVDTYLLTFTLIFLHDKKKKKILKLCD